MEIIHLNHLNSAFRISGSEERRSLKISSVSVEKETDASATLKLVVLDEKDVPVFSQELSDGGEVNSSIDIDQDFAFYDHLTVRITAEPKNSPFNATLNFK
ncbi:hypothetical protein DXT99_15745 [Pontibacter diazotrophicus]|uniref:Uncharacterized protein n=1 Tax=Pontibacter diazotrophicus TaxID=1400979 RepID=A0A3D8LA78_9BACT|nr:hypothetical protein [Pontibacter diazotrophicus]RDV14243.1 hypothetical protein DXT99_15745 [Pontibacter diazotrophicus]